MSLRSGVRRASDDDEPTGHAIEIDAPFLIDTVVGDQGLWAGRVRVDGHVLFRTADVDSRATAIAEARACLAEHLRMLFAGATDTEHQQQTERYGTLVELAAAQVLRAAAGWSLVVARFHDAQIVAVFQRDWPSEPGDGAALGG